MISPSASRNSSYLDNYEAGPYGSGSGSGGGSGYSSSKGAMLAKGQRLNQVGGGGGDYRPSGLYSTQAFNDMLNRTRLSGGGQREASQTGSSTSSTRTVRMGEAPEAPELATFVAPEVDKRAIKAESQKLAAPGIRTLRETVQQAMGKNYENPNVRKMTLREALQGYGSGLEKVMSGANREARSSHMQELDLKREEAQLNFNAQNQMAMASYQNAWADYLKGSETITESQSQSQSEAGPVANTYKIGSRTYTRDPLSGRPVPVY